MKAFSLRTRIAQLGTAIASFCRALYCRVKSSPSSRSDSPASPEVSAPQPTMGLAEGTQQLQHAVGHLSVASQSIRDATEAMAAQTERLQALAVGANAVRHRMLLLYRQSLEGKSCREELATLGRRIEAGELWRRVYLRAALEHVQGQDPGVHTYVSQIIARGEPAYLRANGARIRSWLGHLDASLANATRTIQGICGKDPGMHVGEPAPSSPALDALLARLIKLRDIFGRLAEPLAAGPDASSAVQVSGEDDLADWIDRFVRARYTFYVALEGVPELSVHTPRATRLFRLLRTQLSMADSHLKSAEAVLEPTNFRRQFLQFTEGAAWPDLALDSQKARPAAPEDGAPGGPPS